MEGHPPWGRVACRTKRGDRLHPRSLAPGVTSRAYVIAPGMTGRLEMLYILVQNEYLMTFIVVMWVDNSVCVWPCVRACMVVCVPMCVSVCACTRACVFTRMCLRACACAHTCVYVYVTMCACVHIRLHVCVSIRVRVSTYSVCVCAFAYTCVHAHVYACVHAYVRLLACVYICACMCRLRLWVRKGFNNEINGVQKVAPDYLIIRGDLLHLFNRLLITK